MNPILEKIKDTIRAKVTAPNKQDFERVVTAGKKIMFDKKTHANLEMIKNPEARKDPINTVSKGIAGLMWVMYMQSKQSMSPEVLVMAGIVLMCEFFDFAERGLGIEITNEVVARTTQNLAEILIKKLGITPDQLQQAILTGKKEIDDYQSGALTPEDIVARRQQADAAMEQEMPQ